jgi:small subunit ribosomal protein S1
MENLETQSNDNLTNEEEGQDTTKEENFAELVESSFHKAQEGQIVKGVVVQITPEHVMVDVGSKSEGQIPIDQFMNSEGKLTVAVGDEVEVFLEDMG